jgi:prolipoprotein diacylglyceryltransferase
MYPNLYYVFKDWFGWEIPAMQFLNTFGLMVAIGFIAAAYTLTLELKRKEKLGLLKAREEWIMVGKPASFGEILANAIVGFIFGYKVLGILLLQEEGINTQDYVFSGEGSWLGGFLLAAIMGGMKWYEKNKEVLPQPEKRSVRIWPHDRVGDLVILALIFGVLGAKLFDAMENWDSFIADPIGTIFSMGGLTFYGGLILATVAILWYARKKEINIRHLVDAAAPGLMLAYAIGRLGCQIAGDGDWGVYNSAYVSDEYGNVRPAQQGEFQQQLQQHSTYFLEGYALEGQTKHYVTDRTYPSLEEVPNINFKGPSFLPTWMVAYSYPGNVNNDGISIPDSEDQHHRVLPSPVFPTPFYEFVFGTVLFIILWRLRKLIHTPTTLFGVYLLFNGFERFLIEKIRVNKVYHFMGIKTTQSELIAVVLMLIGIAIIAITLRKKKA